MRIFLFDNFFLYLTVLLWFFLDDVAFRGVSVDEGVELHDFAHSGKHASIGKLLPS